MILHFDADAFFASVEQAADKKLRGHPVAVGGERRGIIASAYRPYGLNTVRYLVVQITAEVMPFDNKSGYTLEVLRLQQARVKNQPPKS